MIDKNIEALQKHSQKIERSLLETEMSPGAIIEECKRLNECIASLNMLINIKAANAANSPIKKVPTIVHP